MTTIVVPPTVLGFTSLDEAFQTRSDVPRSEFVFASQDIIPDPGVGETQSVVYELQLPFGFAYVCVEVTMRITDNGAPGEAKLWGLASSLQLRDGTSSGNSSYSVDSVGLRYSGQSGDEDSVRGSVFYQFDNLPKVVVIARDPNGLCTVVADTVETNQAAVTTRIFARFLQYDVRQAHHYQVNTPTLTR